MGRGELKGSWVNQDQWCYGGSPPPFIAPLFLMVIAPLPVPNGCRTRKELAMETPSFACVRTLTSWLLPLPLCFPSHRLGKWFQEEPHKNETKWERTWTLIFPLAHMKISETIFFFLLSLTQPSFTWQDLSREEGFSAGVSHYVIICPFEIPFLLRVYSNRYYGRIGSFSKYVSGCCFILFITRLRPYDVGSSSVCCGYH